MKIRKNLPAIYKIGAPIACALLTGLAVTGCSSSGSASATAGGGTGSSFSGVVSAGLVNGASVNVYSLNSNGSRGALLGTGTTDANGSYTLNMAAQTSPVVVIASGGSYKEEASGNTINLGNAQLRTVLASTTANQQVGITPVTEIASQYAVAAIAANTGVSLQNVINTSNQTVALAMGLTDITAPPADPSKPATAASSAQAAQYALVLGTISQIAKTAAAANSGTAINSLDIAQALATSLTYNGNFNTSVGVGNTAVPVPNSTGASINLSSVLGGANNFTNAMNNAMSTYVSTADSSYATIATNTAYDGAPTVPSGDSTLAAPTPPPTLPTTSPVIAGPPSTPTPSPTPYVPGGTTGGNNPSPTATPVGTPQAPGTFYNASQAMNGTTNYPMDVEPAVLNTNGHTITNCTTSPALPTGLSINSSTCAITGTPTVTAAATLYTVTVSGGGLSSTTTVTLNVNAPGNHIFINASADGGVISCGLDATTGAFQSCNNLVYMNGGGNWGSSTIDHGDGTATMYIAADGGEVFVCPLNTLTGQVGTCNEKNNLSMGSGQFLTVRTVGSTQYLYAWGTNGGNDGLHVCGISSTDGTPINCVLAETTMHTSGYYDSQSQYHEPDWYPVGIDVFQAGDGNTYAYVSSDYELINGNYTAQDALYRCQVDPATGLLSGCATTSGLAAGVLSALTGEPGDVYTGSVTIRTVGSTTYLYILGENVYKCTVNQSTGVVTPGSCVVTQGTISQYGETNGANHSNPWKPVSISFTNLGGGNTTYAYMSDSSQGHNGTMYQCTVSPTDGTFSNCSASTPAGIANSNPWGNAAF